MSMPMTALADSMTTSANDHEAQRANAYGLLASLLTAPPSPDLLQLLDEIGDREADSSRLATAWKLLRVAARERRGAALDDEYHELFIGLGRGELVPYASWYLTGLLMDRPLAYLRRDLRMLGIERQPGSSEPEDHAATLCECMRVIVCADDVPFSNQRHFFMNYIGSWMPVFFADLQEARAACLYAAVGRLGEAFLEVETRYFALEE